MKSWLPVVLCIRLSSDLCSDLLRTVCWSSISPAATAPPGWGHQAWLAGPYVFLVSWGRRGHGDTRAGPVGEPAALRFRGPCTLKYGLVKHKSWPSKAVKKYLKLTQTLQKSRNWWVLIHLWQWYPACPGIYSFRRQITLSVVGPILSGL